MTPEHPHDQLHLEGRTFLAVGDEHDGDVGADTTFEYHEEPGGVIWARYAGGSVVLGHLTGRRRGDTLDFRYAHLDATGDTASGHCVARLERLADGRLRSHETWEWDSRPGTGTSVVEESEGSRSLR